MKKVALALAGLIAAGVVFYLSRTEYPPRNEQVQGAIGARRLAHGAAVCVTGIQNKSEKTIALEALDDDLVAQLNNVGFKARLASGQGRNDAAAASSNCEATVYGEIVNLKGKDKMEAEVEFRVMIAGDQTPHISSVAKGKSSDPVPANVVLSAMPGKQKFDLKKEPAVIQREAIVAAFGDMARQVEAQRPTRSTRASAE